MENQIPSIEEIKRMTDANKINKLLLESLSKEQVQAINTAYFNKKSIDILASNRKLIPFLTKNQIDSMKKPLSDVINLPRIDNGFYDLFGPLDDIPKIESVYFLISAMSVDQVLQLYTPSFYESWHFIRFLDSESIKYLYGEKLEAIINNKIMDFDLIVYLAPSQIASIKDTNAKISIAPYLTLDQTEKFLWPESSYLTTEEEVQKLNAKYLTEASIILLYHKKSLKFLSEWQFQALKPECFDKNSIKLFQANNLLRYISLDQIKQIKNTDTINALIPHLKSEDEQITKNRAQTLVANSFDQESITLLHDNGLLECLSTDQINQIEDSDAINVLIPYLKSEDEQITKNRVQALVANRFDQESITLLHDNGLLECLSTDQINQIEDTDAINVLIPYLKSENEQITKKRVQALYACDFDQESINLLDKHASSLTPQQINQIHNTNAINALIPHLNNEDQIQALYACDFNQKSINLLDKHASSLTPQQIKQIKGTKKINALIPHLNTKKQVKELSAKKFSAKTIVKLYNSNKLGCLTEGQVKKLNVNCLNTFLIMAIVKADLLKHLTSKQVKNLDAAEFDSDVIISLNKNNLLLHLTAEQIQKIDISRLDIKAITVLIKNNLLTSEQIKALDASTLTELIIKLGLCPKLLRSLNLSDNNVTKLQKIVSTNSNHKPSWSMKKAKTAQIKSILDNANQEQQNIPVVTQEQQI